MTSHNHRPRTELTSCEMCGSRVSLEHMRAASLAWWDRLFNRPAARVSVDEQFISYREAQVLVDSERERCAGVASSMAGDKCHFVDGRDAAEWIALEIRKGTQ